MSHPDITISPVRARQEGSANEYHGHDGIREWVGGLDAATRITFDLHAVQICGLDTALVEASVWLRTAEARSGGSTCSVWRFEDGKVREVKGYPSRDEALAAIG